MKYFSFLGFALLAVLVACQSKPDAPDGASLVKIEIPVGDVQELLFDSLFDDCSLVCLESTVESQLGGINFIRFYDGKFYILDSRYSKSVHVYDSNGRFVRKIGTSGKGPNEYLTPFHFDIDTVNKQLEILSFNKISAYGLDGQFLHSFDFEIGSMYFFKEESTYYFSLLGEKEFNLAKTDHKGKIINQFIPSNFKMILRNAPMCFIPLEGDLLFQPFMSDTVYALTESQAVPCRVVDFGGQKVDLEKYNNLSVEDQMMFCVGKTNGDQCLLYQYLESEKYIHIGYYRNKTKLDYIRNKRTGKFVHFNFDSLMKNYEWETSPIWLMSVEDDCFYYVVMPYNFKSSQSMRTFLSYFGMDENAINGILQNPATFLLLKTDYKI